jgi:cytochrome c peroxidase
VKPLLSTLLSLAISSVVYAQSDILPIPKTLSFDHEKALLGKKLFKDTILSKDNSTSCISCHNLTTNGADSTQYSKGVNSKTTINTPTIFNSVFNFVQFHDGSAKDLKEQLVKGMEKSTHLDMKIEDILSKLEKSSYKQEFAKVFSNGLNKENFITTIVEFEKALITPYSRFDKYLRGDITVLTSQEKKGYLEFQENGCINCHNGVNIGANIYQKMGLFVPYKANNISNGRFDITKRERDKFVYKVPSLRNIAQTAPYFHDGSIKTLSDAVLKMYEHQLGVKKNKKEVANLVAFLKTLDAPKPTILKEGKK